MNIPGISKAACIEQAYQYEAARTIARAAAELRAVADRMDRSAQALVNDAVWEKSAFPNTSCVREALNEYRSVSNAVMFLDSALESAMLADRERASSTGGEG